MVGGLFLLRTWIYVSFLRFIYWCTRGVLFFFSNVVFSFGQRNKQLFWLLQSTLNYQLADYLKLQEILLRGFEIALVVSILSFFFIIQYFFLFNLVAFFIFFALVFFLLWFIRIYLIYNHILVLLILLISLGYLKKNKILKGLAWVWMLGVF